jgi:OOP family OmpA-OmpF porin
MLHDRKIPALLACASTFALSALCANAAAQTGTPRYATDNTGSVVTSGYGLCWRTSQWNPDTTVAGCDPEPPKPVAAAAPAPAPAPEPPPVVAAPAPEPAPPVAAAPLPKKISLSADTLFNFDKSELRPDAKAELDDLVARLHAANVDEITVVGHTDSIGTDQYNQKLSERRANAVKAYLVAQGMSAEKIQAEGKGEREPVADNKTKQGRQENRRVDIQVQGTSTQPEVVGTAPRPGASATATQ